MKQFESIKKIDTVILYLFELASTLSVLLLAFGLIASMANVLTKGNVLTDSSEMQHVWAWTQCIAIDASLPGMIIRAYTYRKQKDWLRFTLYTILSFLLLFTAAIVSNVEAIQQTLNITLQSAYLHIPVPVEALIWVRSIVVVLLIVAHALRHVQPEKAVQPAVQKAKSVSVHRKAVGKQNQDNLARVKEYMTLNPGSSVRTVAAALTISPATANKWMRHKREPVLNEQKTPAL